MAAVPLLVSGGIGLASYFFGKKKGAKQAAQQQQQAQAPTPAQPAENTVPATPTPVAKDESNAVLAGAQAAQRVRRSAVAQQQRRPSVPSSTALRAPSLIAG